jgi:hypothetical protein
MAKWSFGNTNWTPTATADAAALANATYQALKGGSTTQRLEVVEIYMAGNANSVNSPTFMQFARNSTLGITPTALAAPMHDGPLDPNTAALGAPPVSYCAAGTGPLRSNATTSARLDLGINALGGIVRWVAAFREEWIIFGNAVTVGESSLSAFTGGTPGALNSHIIYEPF